MRFLVESKAVYETLEGIVAEAHHPDCEHPYHAKSVHACKRRRKPPLSPYLACTSIHFSSFTQISMC